LGHQAAVVNPLRTAWLFDYGYIQEAQALGFPNAVFGRSITYAGVLSTLPPAEARSMPVLLLIDPPSREWQEEAPPPSAVDQAFAAVRRVVREALSADLGRDPRVEVRRAFTDLGVAFDSRKHAHRQLLTATLEDVRLAREQAVLEALAGLPVTVASTSAPGAAVPTGVRWVQVRDFREKLALMRRADVVVRPSRHHSGFDPLVMAALTAGAAVVTSPNTVLEGDFAVGQDLLVYRSAAQARALVADLLSSPERGRQVGMNGQLRAADRCSSTALADSLLRAYSNLAAQT
jgi:glycosyltransferase involved in cell wall biosynthesis